MLNKILAILLLVVALLWVILQVGAYFNPSWRETADTIRHVLNAVGGLLAVAIAASILLTKK